MFRPTPRHDGQPIRSDFHAVSVSQPPPVLALLGSAAALSGFRPATAAEGEIKVLNWQGYGTDEKWALEMFEKKTGIKVVHDYFNSEQEMLTKLRTSPGTYDVVLMNNIYVMEAANEGLIQPIDTAQDHQFRRPHAVAARFRPLREGRQALCHLLGVGPHLLRLQHREDSRARPTRSRRCGIPHMPARSAGATMRSNRSRLPRSRPART